MADAETIATLVAINAELVRALLSDKPRASGHSARQKRYRERHTVTLSDAQSDALVTLRDVTRDARGGLGGVSSKNGSASALTRGTVTAYEQEPVQEHFAKQDQELTTTRASDADGDVLPVTRDAKRDAKRYTPYAAEFEACWTVYPKRPSNSKKAAQSAYVARRRDGVTPDDLFRATVLYSKQCVEAGTEPQYVKMGQTFYGHGEHWKAVLESPVIEAPVRREDIPQRAVQPVKPLTPEQLAQAERFAAMDRSA